MRIRFWRPVRTLRCRALLAVLLLPALAGANPWQDLAKADLAYIRQTVEENHPGMVDPDNPAFRRELDEHYQAVVSQMRFVHSLDAVFNLDRQFVASFADVHFELNLRFAPVAMRWAGIRIARRNSRYVVTGTEAQWPAKLPAVGSELLSCDGRPTEEIMRQEVLRYRFANEKDEFPRLRFASRLFIDDGIGYRTYPKHCEFSDRDGTAESLAVVWQYGVAPVPSAGPAQFGVERLRGDTAWVRIPTFTLWRKADELPFEQMIRDLETVRDTGAATLVLDVRGNGGGNSALGLRVLGTALGNNNFWTLRAAHPPAASPPARYRASPGNLAAIRALLAQEDRGPEYAHQLEMLADAMTRDLGVHRDLTLQPQFQLPKSLLPDAAPSIAAPKLPHLVLLTDRWCVSACLDFVIETLALPHVVHVGETTGADSPYNEPLRFREPFELPSHLGFFHIPSKIVGARGPFQPSIPYDGDIDDTGAVREWVLGLPAAQSLR